MLRLKIVNIILMAQKCLYLVLTGVSQVCLLKRCCSTTVDDVARYFAAHAVIIKLCYQGSVLSTLSECAKNVLTQPNVKKSFLEDI